MLDDENPHPEEIGIEKLIPLQELWAEVSRFPVWDTTAALRCFLSGVCKILDAKEATWMVTRKQAKLPREISSDHYQTIFEAMGGWSPMTAEYLNSGKEFKRVADRWLMYARKDGIDPMGKMIMKDAGKHPRACIRQDVSTDQEWAEHWMSRKFLEFYGVGERLIAALPLSEICESFMIIDRPLNEEPYLPEDRDFMKFAIASVPGLQKRLCLERGLLGSSSALSNRETDTYRLLLTDLSESEIAEKLGLSIHTVHDYARQLYRKFKVKGRVGLMAMVLEI